MQPSNKYLSKGLTRSRTDNLVVMRGGSEPNRRPRIRQRHRDGLATAPPPATATRSKARSR